MRTLKVSQFGVNTFNKLCAYAFFVANILIAKIVFFLFLAFNYWKWISFLILMIKMPKICKFFMVFIKKKSNFATLSQRRKTCFFFVVLDQFLSFYVVCLKIVSALQKIEERQCNFLQCNIFCKVPFFIKSGSAKPSKGLFEKIYGTVYYIYELPFYTRIAFFWEFVKFSDFCFKNCKIFWLTKLRITILIFDCIIII